MIRSVFTVTPHTALNVPVGAAVLFKKLSGVSPITVSFPHPLQAEQHL